MSKNTTELLSIEEWTENLIRTLIMENIKLLAEEEKRLGAHYKGHLFTSFLASFVGALLYKTVEGKAKSSKAFVTMQGLVEDAVAAGFSGAVTQATGKSAEYYCQVKVVPEPSSKEVC